MIEGKREMIIFLMCVFHKSQIAPATSEKTEGTENRECSQERASPESSALASGGGTDEDVREENEESISLVG